MFGFLPEVPKLTPTWGGPAPWNVGPGSDAKNKTQNKHKPMSTHCGCLGGRFFSGLFNGPEDWLRFLAFRTYWYITVISARNLPFLEIIAGVSNQIRTIHAFPLSTTNGRCLHGYGPRRPSSQLWNVGFFSDEVRSLQCADLQHHGIFICLASSRF